jgi:hypothetical protein
MIEVGPHMTQMVALRKRIFKALSKLCSVCQMKNDEGAAGGGTARGAGIASRKQRIVEMADIRKTG